MRTVNELKKVLGIPLSKGKTYIDSPGDAPEGVKVQRGPKGGYYYTEGIEAETPFEIKEINVKKYGGVMDFAKDNVAVLKKHGIDNMKKATELFNRMRLDSFKPIKTGHDSAVDTIKQTIPDRIMGGWFRNEDKSFKVPLFNAITKSDEVRSAGIEIMRNSYNVLFDKKVSFDAFLDTELTLYRGGNITDDIFTSFSMDKKIAEKFKRQYQTDKINEIKIKPRDTLGSYQTTAEAEILIPKANL